MTRRIVPLRRRATASEQLCIGVEMAAAGYLFGWLATAEWHSRRFWAAIAHSHGDRIIEKVRVAFPGCRPGFQYAIGMYPPIPILKPLPPTHLNNREKITIEGVEHWYVGEPWQKCQAEHLRDIGELDGGEWRRYLAWKREGFTPRYVPDASPDDRPMKCIAHLCW